MRLALETVRKASTQRTGLKIALFLLLGLALSVLIIGRDITERHAKFEQERQTYQSALETYQNTNLSSSLLLYAPSPLAGSYKPVGASQRDTSYTVSYAGADNNPILELEGTAANIPTYCESTLTPRVQRTQHNEYFSCNIVMRAGDRDIYGYRELMNLSSRGIDPARLTATELRSIQPTTFYIRPGNTTVSLRYQGADQTKSPLTPAVMTDLANKLIPLEGAAREAFITQYLKPPKPMHEPIPVSYPLIWYIAMLGFLLYTPVLVYSVMRVFAKAGKPSWLALAPLVNGWVLYKIADQPPWRSLLLLVPAFFGTPLGLPFLFSLVGPLITPFLGVIILANAFFLLQASIALAQKFGKNKAFGLLLFVPPLPGYFILGLGTAQYKDPN